MPAKAIFNLNLFDGEKLIPESWVIIDESIIEFGVKDGWKKHGHTAEDGLGGYLTPKLIDTHVHGGNGNSNDDGAEAMSGTIAYHSSQGVGKTLLSLISAPVASMVELIVKAHDLDNANFLGLHLEGPFISELFKGAHDPSVLHAPTDKELDDIIQASQGLVKSMTVAPELISTEQLGRLMDNGIEPCFGHSSADYEATKNFFALGPKIMTHAFNGMAGIHHRAPGPVPAALEANIFTELIADGVHVAPSASRLLKPESVILVTDAMAATGLSDGRYYLGSMAVTVQDSIARTDGGSIAGSTLVLKTAVKNYATWTANPLAALRAAITNPALAYGFEIPRISKGQKEFLLWDKDLELLN